MDTAGVDEAVVVGYPICEWTDNWYTIRAVEAHDRLMGIVLLNPFEENACETLREAMSVDGILGFRLGATYDYERMWEEPNLDASWVTELPSLTDFWNTAIATDAVVQIATHPSQIDQSRAVIERYPDLSYVFDHFVGVDGADLRQDGSAPVVEPLAEFDSVAIKISAAPYLSDDAFPYPDIHDHVRWLLDTFGRERVIWGSDFPNVSGVATYEQTLDWLDEVDELSAADKTWLTRRAFMHHLRRG